MVNLLNQILSLDGYRQTFVLTMFTFMDTFVDGDVLLCQSTSSQDICFKHPRTNLLCAQSHLKSPKTFSDLMNHKNNKMQIKRV